MLKGQLKNEKAITDRVIVGGQYVKQVNLTIIEFV